MSRYLIVGYGGIGKAVTEQLLQQGNEVVIVSRRQHRAPRCCQYLLHDFSDVTTTQAMLQQLPELPDVIINTIGVLHDEQHQPEKALKYVESDWLCHSMAINLLPTLYLTQALTTRMTRASQLILLVLSARVSSISDNRLGGWYSYRMSKAALNMLVKNISIEWSRTYPQAAIFGYHPGTVDTPLSKPFQSNVPEAQLFSPAQAASYLLATLAQLDIEQSGCLYDWQGKKIDY